MDDSCRPEQISMWNWLRHQYADLDHWQQCLVAACNAEAKDPEAAAHTMYLRQGGKLAILKRKKDLKPAKPTTAQKTKAGRVRPHQPFP